MCVCSDATARIGSLYGVGNGTVWLDRLYCGGSENYLLDCPKGVPLGSTNCRFDEMAGVFCPCEYVFILFTIKFTAHCLCY